MSFEHCHDSIAACTLQCFRRWMNVIIPFHNVHNYISELFIFYTPNGSFMYPAKRLLVACKKSTENN